MTSILLAPHNDDETLFASFICLREKPLVVVCYRSHIQEVRGTGITADTREAETQAAMNVLDCRWAQMTQPDTNDSVDQLRAWLVEYGPVDKVFAPKPEMFGHDQHNAVGELASELYGDRVEWYLTYTRATGRSRSARPIAVEKGWARLKLLALACYTSQIDEPSTRDHFLGDLWEYQ